MKRPSPPISSGSSEDLAPRRSILPLSGTRGSGDVASEHTGLEAILGMAAAQPEFARALAAEPARAVEATGLELSATERAVVAGVDQASLGQLVAGVDRSLPSGARRQFLQLAGAALLVLGGGSLAGCEDKDKGKAAPQAGSGTAQPKAGTAQPKAGTAQPKAGTAQPKAGTAQPKAGTAQPKVPDKTTAADPRPRVNRGVRPDRPPPRAIGGLTTDSSGSAKPTKPSKKPPKPREERRSRGIRPDRPRPRRRGKGSE
jgi:hypothetical protein